MAALFRTAVLMAMIAMVHASTDDIKHTTVGGPSLALIETSVTTNTVGGPSLALIETSVTTNTVGGPSLALIETSVTTNTVGGPSLALIATSVTTNTVGGPSLALIETSVTTNTVGGPSLALIETSVTTSEASRVAHNMIPSIGQRDATLNETIDFDQQNKVLYKSVDMQVLGTQKSNPHIRLLISELNKSAAQRRNVRKHIRTKQRKRFAGWLFSSRSKMFRSDLG